MKMPEQFNDYLLAAVDSQIRALLRDHEMSWIERESELDELCMKPWDVAAVFEVPYSEIGEVMDRYELKAVTTSSAYAWAIGLPDIQAVNEDFHNDSEVPYFSPKSVYLALQRKHNGDQGITPPQITCDIDRSLRSMWRRWSSTRDHLSDLATDAHDRDLLLAALRIPGRSNWQADLSDLIARNGIWATREVLSLDDSDRYREDYQNYPIGLLYQAYSLKSLTSPIDAEWVSPAIIPLIEDSDLFSEALKQPSWLLYKAVRLLKGQLPEEDHNRMVAEAAIKNPCGKAYLDFIHPPGLSA